MNPSPTGTRSSIARARRALLCPLAVALLLGACGSPRDDAASELSRLGEAMREHAAQHGRFPQTLDPARPASADNLPHTPGRDVSLSLSNVRADGYVATARHGSWTCWMGVGPGQNGVPDCAPHSASLPDTPDSVGQPSRGVPGVLTTPAAPPADSSAPANPSTAP